MGVTTHPSDERAYIVQAMVLAINPNQPIGVHEVNLTTKKLDYIGDYRIYKASGELLENTPPPLSYGYVLQPVD